MYKVYLSRTIHAGLGKEICGALPKDEFVCGGDRDHAGYLDDPKMDELSSDVFLCGASPDLSASSCDVDTELSRVWGERIPAVVIRCSNSEEYCGVMSIERIVRSECARLFDLSDGRSAAELPAFLKETIQAYRDGKGLLELNESLMPNPPYKGEEDYLFVSYAVTAAEQIKAYPLIRNLQDHGYRVWFHGYESEYPDAEEIADRIEHCSCMIALISPRYIAAESCKDEISLARDLNKERILVYLQKTKMPTGMAMRLLRLQAIHKYTYKSYQDFYQKLYSSRAIRSAKG